MTNGSALILLGNLIAFARPALHRALVVQSNGI